LKTDPARAGDLVGHSRKGGGEVRDVISSCKYTISRWTGRGWGREGAKEAL